MIGAFSDSNKGIPGANVAQLANPFASFVKKVESSQGGKLPGQGGLSGNPFYKGNNQQIGPSIQGLGTNTQAKPMDNTMSSGMVGAGNAATTNIFGAQKGSASGGSAGAIFGLNASKSNFTIQPANGGLSNNLTNNSTQNKTSTSSLGLNITNSMGVNVGQNKSAILGSNNTMNNMNFNTGQNKNIITLNTNPINQGSNPLSQVTNPLMQNGQSNNPFSHKINTISQGSNIFGQNMNASNSNTNFLTQNKNPFPVYTNPLTQITNPLSQNTNPLTQNANPLNLNPSFFGSNTNPLNQNNNLGMNPLNQNMNPLANQNMLNMNPCLNNQPQTRGPNLQQSVGSQAPHFSKQSLAPVVQTIFTRILSNPEGEDGRNSLKFTRIMLSELAERMELMKPKGKLKPQFKTPEWNTPVEEFSNKQMLLKFLKDQKTIRLKIEELKSRQEQLLAESDDWEAKFLDRMIRSRQVIIDAIARSKQIAKIKENTQKMSEQMASLKTLYAPAYRNVPFSDPDEFCLQTADKIHKDYMKLDQRIEDLLVLQKPQKESVNQQELVIMLKEYTVGLSHRLQEVRQLEDELRDRNLISKYEVAEAWVEKDELQELLEKLDGIIAKRSRLRFADR